MKKGETEDASCSDNLNGASFVVVVVVAVIVFHQNHRWQKYPLYHDELEVCGPCNFILRNTFIFVISSDLRVKFREPQKFSFVVKCAVNWLHTLDLVALHLDGALPPTSHLLHTLSRTLISTRLFLPDTVKTLIYLFPEGLLLQVKKRLSTLCHNRGGNSDNEE